MHSQIAKIWVSPQINTGRMKQWAGIFSNLSFLWNFSVLGVPTALSKYHRKISQTGYRALGHCDFLCDLQWHLFFIELGRLHHESHHNLPPLRQNILPFSLSELWVSILSNLNLPEVRCCTFSRFIVSFKGNNWVFWLRSLFSWIPRWMEIGK